MAFCSKCGTQIPDDAKFCPACGNVNEAFSQPYDETEQETVVLSKEYYEEAQQETTVLSGGQNVVAGQEIQGDTTNIQPDFTAQQQPEGAVQMDFTAQQQPDFTAQQQAEVQPDFGAQQQPESAAQMDFTAQQQAGVQPDFGAQQQPEGAAQMDFTAQQQAGVQPDFGAQQQPEGAAQMDFTAQQQAGVQPDFGTQQQTTQQLNYGAQQPQNFNGKYANQYNGQQPQSKKPNKLLKNKKALIAIIAAVVVVIAGIIIGVSIYNYNKKKVDLNECISVEFDGYESKGKVKASIDETKFARAVLKAKGKSSSSDWEDLLSSGVTTYELLGSIEIEVTPDENLKNGDKVTVKIYYDNDLAKEAGIRFTAKDQEYTVEGLKTAKELDPFEKFEIMYSGTAPNGYATAQYSGNDGVLSSYMFKLSKTSKLSNGDKITVTVNVEEEDVLAKGYVLTQTSKEYTVSGLKEYLSKCSDVDADTLAVLQKNSVDEIEASYATETDITKSELKYEGMYVLSSKTSGYNSIILVYSTILTSNEGKFDPTTVYLPVEVDDVYKDEDGKVQIDSYSYYSLKGYSDIMTSSGFSEFVKGYTDTGKMFSDLISSNKSRYNYDMTEGLKQFGE